ncbi:MAG: PEP-CTERM sorting domain-containing protein [Planctomycetota bacterium]|nr:PEP-CTERM sorting domain-containing protein [Planctomycetota bacterium]
MRQIYFDDIQFPGSSILLSDVQADDWGTVNTSLGSFFAVKTGGDVGLFPLFSDWDNLVLRQEGTDFHGVSNVNDLTEPNANLLGPSTNQVVQINFGEGIDLGDGTIANFGLVEAVGAFVSTEGNVTLSIFDVDGLLISEISTPGSIGAFSPPYFLGIVLPPDNGVKQEIISRAVFSFDSVAALDGLVYTSVVDAQPPFVIPEPSTLGLVGIGLAGLAGLRRRKNK